MKVWEDTTAQAEKVIKRAELFVYLFSLKTALGSKLRPVRWKTWGAGKQNKVMAIGAALLCRDPIVSSNYVRSLCSRLKQALIQHYFLSQLPLIHFSVILRRDLRTRGSTITLVAPFYQNIVIQFYCTGWSSHRCTL